MLKTLSCKKSGHKMSMKLRPAWRSARRRTRASPPVSRIPSCPSSSECNNAGDRLARKFRGREEPRSRPHPHPWKYKLHGNVRRPSGSGFEPFSSRGTSTSLSILLRNLNVQNSTIYSILKELPGLMWRNLGWKPLLYRVCHGFRLT